MEPRLAVAVLGISAHVVAVIERGEVQEEEACQRARDAAHEPYPKRPANSVVVRLRQPLAVLPGHKPDEEQRRQVDESWKNETDCQYVFSDVNETCTMPHEVEHDCDKSNAVKDQRHHMQPLKCP